VYAHVNDIRIYYEWHGPEGGSVLVLNNGILMNAAASWSFQTPALARHHRVLLYDCRGQGQSDHPNTPYTMEGHADDLAGLLDVLQVNRAHIAGISYGGEVAQAFALKHPARLHSLVLADTVSEVGPELRHIVLDWLAHARRGDPEGFFQATVPWNFSPHYIATNPQVIAAARKRYTVLDYPAIERLCECFLEVDFTEHLCEISAPACLIVGERDLLKGRAYTEILHRRLRNSELHLLPGAGHASCWERPAEFNTVVLGFLAQQDQLPPVS
jgi:3-oxoadipate enol-lactonase